MIVTTASKAKLAKGLYAYWSLKGEFYRNRADPQYGQRNPDFYDRVVAYIEDQTDLAAAPFWVKLTSSQKVLAARCLTLSDDSPSRMKIEFNDLEAEVVIVMHGQAVVTSYERGEEIDTTTYSQGKSFGALYYFDAVQAYELDESVPGKRSMKLVRTDPTTPRPKTTLQWISVEKGTLLRMTIAEFKRIAMGYGLASELQQAEAEPEESDESISGIPTELMTEADKVCVRVRRMAKKRLAHFLYEFMANFDLIPNNASIMSSEFVVRGMGNSEMRAQPNMVYVIIDGVVRLQVVRAGKAKSKGSLLGCVRSGTDDHALQIRTKNMPLGVYEAGTIIHMKEECFTVGLPPISTARDLPAGTLKPQYKSTLQASRSEGELPVASARELDRAKYAQSKAKKSPPQPTYDVSLFFEKSAVLLSIPINVYRGAILEVPPKVQTELESQLTHSHDTIFARVLKTAPWILGTMNLEADSLDAAYPGEPGSKTGLAAFNSTSALTHVDPDSVLKGSFEGSTWRDTLRAAGPAQGPAEGEAKVSFLTLTDFFEREKEQAKGVDVAMELDPTTNTPL